MEDATAVFEDGVEETADDEATPEDDEAAGALDPTVADALADVTAGADGTAEPDDTPEPEPTTVVEDVLVTTAADLELHAASSASAPPSPSTVSRDRRDIRAPVIGNT